MATRKRKTFKNSTVRLPYNRADAVAPSANPAKPLKVMHDGEGGFEIRGTIRGVAIVARTNEYTPRFGTTPEEFLRRSPVRWIHHEEGGNARTIAREKAVLAALKPAVIKAWEAEAGKGEQMKRDQMNFRSRTRNPPSRGRLDEHAAQTLALYIDNDRNLNSLTLDIYANYAKKKERGTFTFDKAVAGLMRNLVNVAARGYWREHKSITEPLSAWSRHFSLATRDSLATEYAQRFLEWYRLDYQHSNPAGAYRQHFPRTAAGRPQVPHKWEVEMFDSKGNRLGSRKWKGKSREEARAAAQELVGTKLRKKNVASVVLDGPHGR